MSIAKDILSYFPIVILFWFLINIFIFFRSLKYKKKIPLFYETINITGLFKKSIIVYLGIISILWLLKFLDFTTMINDVSYSNIGYMSVIFLGPLFNTIATTGNGVSTLNKFYDKKKISRILLFADPSLDRKWNINKYGNEKGYRIEITTVDNSKSIKGYGLLKEEELSIIVNEIKKLGVESEIKN